jgi:hypothetical protein
MLQAICDAIHQRATLTFAYKGEWREVEPHTYGRMANGEEGLCAWQVSGSSGSGYRLFLIGKLTSLTVSGGFDGPRQDYHKGDQRFQCIYAEL